MAAYDRPVPDEESGGSIHLVQALRGGPATRRLGSLSQLTYLHVRVSRVNVTDA